MTPKSTFKDRIDIVCKIWEEDRKLSNLKGGGPNLFAPAKKVEIDAFEKKQGCAFPGEYREFLAITNGMVGFNGTFTLIGAQQKATDKALKDITKFRKCWLENWEEENGEATDGNVAKYEKKVNLKKETETEARIFVANKLIFGTDFFGGVYFFMPPAKGKEPPVVFRDEFGEIAVFDSFKKMIEAYINVGVLPID
jgi:cell wall assembly regulator SMI1